MNCFICPNCNTLFHIGEVAKPQTIVVADYVAKFRGFSPIVFEQVTQEEMDKRTLGQEELEYVYEIPGTSRER